MTDTAYGAPTEPLPPAVRRLCVVVVLGSIMTVLDTTIVNVAVEVLGRDLHARVATIQWVATGYLLALALAIPLTGWAIERVGARRLWLGALVAFLVGSVLSGVAWSAGALIAFRIVQGAAGGVLAPVGQTLLARAAGPERMGRVMGIVAAPTLLGPVLGPILGGLILDQLSWRWLFYVNVPVGAVALVAAWRWLAREDADPVRTPLDVAGALLLSPGLAALVYGLTEAGLGSPGALVGTAAGLALVAAFVVRARRVEHPLLDPRLFADRTFAAAGAAMLLLTASLFGALFLYPLYAQAARGASALSAGALLVPQGLAYMAAMPVGGRLSERIGARPLVLAGTLIEVAGLVPLTQAGAHTSQALLSLSGIPRGIGLGLAFPPLIGEAYRTLAPAAIPRASTVVAILQRLGGALGTAAFAVVLQDGLDAGRGAAAYGSAAWWVLGATALMLVPVAALPTSRPSSPACSCPAAPGTARRTAPAGPPRSAGCAAARR